LAQVGRSLISERVAPDVADATISTGIAPRPAEAVIEHREGGSDFDLADRRRIFLGRRTKQRFGGDEAVQRLGIMRRNDAPGECNVGKVLAVGVDVGIRRV